MNLGICGAADDPVTAHVANSARARGHDTHILPEDPAGLATDLQWWLWDDVAVDALDAVMVQRLPPFLLGPTPGEAADGVARRIYAGFEQQGFAVSCLHALAARGVVVVNPWHLCWPFEHKALQLAALRQAGLPVPQTMATNVGALARRFVRTQAQAGREVIVKPFVGGATARLVDDGLSARLSLLGPSPVLLQERVPGEDVRVTVVDGRIISSVSIGSSALDYRDDPEYRAGRAHYQTCTLTTEMEAAVLAAARVCQHVISGVDLKRSSHEFTLLEVNSAPSYLDIEQQTGARITDAILDAITVRVAVR